MFIESREDARFVAGLTYFSSLGLFDCCREDWEDNDLMYIYICCTYISECADLSITMIIQRI